MNASKEKALICWINELGFGHIESLSDLRDGKLLSDIAKLVDADAEVCACDSSPAQLLDWILGVLTEFYKTRASDFVDVCSIFSGDSLEIAKICLLLLSAGVIRNHVITEKALRLDDSLQFEVKDLVSSLVIPGKQPNHIDPNYAQVLFESCGAQQSALASVVTRRGTSTPSAPTKHARTVSTPLTLARPASNSDTLTPVCSMDGAAPSRRRMGRVDSLLDFISPVGGGSMIMSPVQELMQSPTVKNRILLDQQDQKLKTLIKDLDFEKKQKRLLEDELKIREDACDRKDAELRELETRLVTSEKRCRRLCNEVEEATRAQPVVASPDAQTVRIRELVAKNKELKQTNEVLEKDNADVYTKLHESTRKVNHMEKKCAELEASVAQTHAEMRELNSALQRTTSETAILVEELEHSREEVKRLTRELEVSSTSSTDSARMKALTNTSLSTSMVATLFPEPTDRRETLADVEERILRDQLLSAQETLNQVQEQRDALDAEKAALVQEKAQLQEVFQHTKQEVAELQTRCGEWERRTQQAEAQRAELDSQLQLTSSTLQATINQLKQQVQQVEATLHASQQEVQASREAHAQVTGELQQLQIQHQQDMNQLAQAGGQLEQLRRTLECSQQEWVAAEARLRGEVEEATLRVETMSRELEEGRVTWVQLEQSFNVKLHDAEQRHAETGRELTAKLSEEQLRSRDTQQCLEEKLLKAEYDMKELREAHAAQLAEAQKRLVEAECSLNSQRQEAETRVRELEAQRLDVETKLRADVQETQRRLVEAEQNMNDLFVTQQTSAEKERNLTAELEMMRKQEMELKTKIEEAYQKHSELEQSLEEELQKAEQKYKEMEEKLTEQIRVAHLDQVERYNNMEQNLKTQIANAESKHEQATSELMSCCQEWERKCQATEKIVQEKTEKLSELQAELNDANNNHRNIVFDLNTQISELTQCNGNLEEKFKKTMEEVNKKLMEQQSKYNEDIAAMESKCTDLGQMLNGELRNTHEKFEEAEQRLKESHRATVEQLKLDLETQNKELMESRQTVEKLKLAKARHDDMERAQDEHLVELEGEKERLNEELNAVIADKVELEHQLEEAQDHADSATRDLENVREDLDEARTQLEQTQTRCSAVELELEASVDREQNQAANIEHYKEELARIETVHSDMLQQLQFHKDKVSKQQGALDTYEQVVDRMKEEIQHARDKETELSALLQASTEKESELANLLKNSQEVQEQRKETVAQAITQISKFQQELLQEKAKNEELQQKLVDHDGLAAQLEAASSAELILQQRLDSAESGRVDLQRQLDHKQEHLVAMQDKVDLLKRELELAEEQAKQSQEQRTVKEHQVDSLETQLKQTRDELENQQLEAARRVAEKEEAMETLQREAEVATDEYHNQVMRKQAEVESLKTQLEMLTGEKDGELDALHQELTCRNEQKQRDAQHISSLEHKVQSLELKCQELTVDLRSVTNEREQVQCSSDTERKDLKMKLTELEILKKTAEGKFKEKIKELELQVEELKSTCTSEKRSHSDEVRNLEEKLHKVSTECELQLRTQNATVQQKEQEMKKLVEQLQSNEDQCCELMASLATSQNEQMKLDSELEEQKKLCSQAEEQSKELEAALEELKGQFVEAQRTWNEQVTAFDELKSKHEATEHEKGKYTVKLSEVEQLLQQTKGELLDVQKKLQDKSCWEISARANMIDMETEVSRLEGVVRERDERVKELDTEVRTVTNERNLLQDTLDQTTNTSVVLQQELDGRQQKLETLAARFDEINKEKRDKENALRRDAEEMIASARRDMDEFKDLYTNASNSLQQARERVATLEDSKQSLERELQETLEALESSQEEVMSLTDRLQALEEEQQDHAHDVQARLVREKQLLDAHQVELEKAAELNKKTRETAKQKEAEVKELKQAKNKLQRELEKAQTQLSDAASDHTRNVATLKREFLSEKEEAAKKHRHHLEQVERRYAKQLEESAAKADEAKLSHRRLLSDAKDKHTKEINREKMRIKKLEEELDRLRDRGDAESGRTVDLKAQLDSAKEQVAHYQDETRRLDRDVTRLTGQKAEHDLIVKRLGSQVRSLEAQVEHANRQLKNKCTCGGVLPAAVPVAAGPASQAPPSASPRELRSSRNSIVTRSASKLNDSLEEGSGGKKYNLRSTGSEGDGEGSPLSLQDLDSSLSSKVSKSSEDWTPLGTKQHVTRPEDNAMPPPKQRVTKMSRLSLSSTASAGFEPTRSDRVPRGTGALFAMDDEPEDFEWNRLSELQRRNTLCLPHQKTSYPVEMQTRPLKDISENKLQKGPPEEEGVQSEEKVKEKQQRRLSRKRRSMEMLDDSLDRLSIQGSADKRSKRRQNDAQGLSTPGVKLYKHYSPAELLDASPMNAIPEGPTPRQRGRRNTPASGRKGRQQPQVGIRTMEPQPFSLSRNVENSDAQGKQPPPPKENVAFSIGITPKKSLRRLTRIISSKKSTEEATPRDSSKVKKKPLGDHNQRLGVKTAFNRA